MTIRVLIADDHAVVAEAIAVLLKAEGDIEVLGRAADGAAAIRGACELCPDVVLMDQSMPGINGIEATREIRERQPAVRVLMFSAYSDAVHVVRALRAGASGYISKRAFAAEVIEAIREVHAGRRYLPAPLMELVFQYLGAAEPEADPLAALSRRERQVLQMLAEGSSMQQIAEALSISLKTVETYRSRMMQKLGLRDFASLVKLAVRQGVVPLD